MAERKKRRATGDGTEKVAKKAHRSPKKATEAAKELPPVRSEDGFFLLRHCFRHDTLPLLTLSVTLPDPSAAEAAGARERAARARIADFYRRMAEALFFHAAEEIFPHLQSAYESTADPRRRHSFPRTALTVEGLITQEDGTCLSAVRRLRLTAGGRVCTEQQEGEVFSLATGRLCPLRALRGYARPEETPISQHTGGLIGKLRRIFPFRQMRACPRGHAGFYLEGGLLYRLGEAEPDTAPMQVHKSPD